MLTYRQIGNLKKSYIPLQINKNLTVIFFQFTLFAVQKIDTVKFLNIIAVSRNFYATIIFEFVKEFTFGCFLCNVFCIILILSPKLNAIPYKNTHIIP